MQITDTHTHTRKSTNDHAGHPTFHSPVSAHPLQEWTVEEQALGLHLGAMRFAEESRSQRFGSRHAGSYGTSIKGFPMPSPSTQASVEIAIKVAMP